MYQTVYKKEKASFQLFSVSFICNVMINGTLNTPIFYHSDKAQLLGSRLRQWNLPEKGVLISFYRKRQSDMVTYHSVDDDHFC